MAGLERYVEWLGRGRRTERVAYVINKSNVPKPLPGAEWQLDPKFNAAEEVLGDPALKATFKAALEKGSELVIQKTEIKAKEMARKVGGRPWAPQEDVILRELAAAGKLVFAIAVEMNRSEAVIRRRAKEGGIKIAKFRAQTELKPKAR
jgi:hypothetical protein